jgi:hypothetical protein
MGTLWPEELTGRDVGAHGPPVFQLVRLAHVINEEQGGKWDCPTTVSAPAAVRRRVWWTHKLRDVVRPGVESSGH